MSKTFNRGKLRKLVEAGRVVMTGSYHYDDMMGQSGYDKPAPLPVRMKPERYEDRKQGVVYLDGWDFKTKSGHAYYSNANDDSQVSLIVHSNCNYELRILPELPTLSTEDIEAMQVEAEDKALRRAK